MAEEEPRFAEQVIADKPIAIEAAKLVVEVEWLEIKVGVEPN